MSRRRVCYWPRLLDQDWLLLNLDESDEEDDDDVDLNVAYTCYNPAARYSPISRYSPTTCYNPSPRHSRTTCYNPSAGATPTHCCCRTSSPALTTPSSCCCYNRPWRYQSPIKSGFSTIQDKKDTFRVSLDVKSFKDGDLTVKVVGKQVVVEAQHSEREDEHGLISRSMKRKYTLPDDVDVEDVKTELSSDGVLTITAPKKKARAGSTTEHLIPIRKVSKPALKSKTTEEKKDKAGSSQDVGVVITDADGDTDADADDGDGDNNDVASE